MEKFKSKYSSDSKEYLLSFMLNPLYNKHEPLYVHGNKVDSIEDVNLDDLSFGERCCVLMECIIDGGEEKVRDSIHIVKKYEKEFRTLINIFDKTYDENKNNLILDFDESKSEILLYVNDKEEKQTTEEFLKDIPFG